MKGYAKSIFTKLFDFEKEETAGEVVFFRIFEIVILYWVFLFAWKWGFYIPRIGTVILPLGIANYVDVSVLFSHGLSIWNAGLISLFAIAGFIRFTRIGYPAAFVLLHLQYAARFSLGEISHGANVIGFALLGMALGAVFFANPLKNRRFVLGFCYFFIGLGYTLAAFSKLVASGPLWVDGVHMWMWIGERTVDTFSITGTESYTFIQRWILDSRVFATIVLSFGLITELFGFTMWFPERRWIVMTLLIMMHFGILLSMKISFPANDTMLILLAYPWARGLDRILLSFDSSFIDRVRRIEVGYA